MKLRTLTRALQLVAAALALALLPDPAQANPRLTIPNDTCNFGFLPSGATATYRYWLKSTGSTPLEVEWADGSCPCAELPVAQKVIEPGDSVAFELIFHTGKVTGSVTRRPHVKTNADPEPARPWFQGKVVSDIKSMQPVGMQPFRADLSAFGQFKQDTARIQFLNNSDDPIVEFKMIHVRSEYFTVILPTEAPPRGTAEALVIINPDTPEQAFEKSFTIEVTHRVIGDVNTITRLTVPVRRKYAAQ